jgi:hypothetical protein
MGRGAGSWAWGADPRRPSLLRGPSPTATFWAARGRPSRRPLPGDRLTRRKAAATRPVHGAWDQQPIHAVPINTEEEWWTAPVPWIALVWRESSDQAAGQGQSPWPRRGARTTTSHSPGLVWWSSQSNAGTTARSPRPPRRRGWGPTLSSPGRRGHHHRQDHDANVVEHPAHVPSPPKPAR